MSNVFFYKVETQGNSNDSYRFSIFRFEMACVVIGHEIIKQRFKKRTTLSDELHIKQFKETANCNQSKWEETLISR